jgi:Na+/glutamate symporter
MLACSAETAIWEANMTMLPLWQRLIATIVAMLVASFAAGLLWQALFNFPLPSYAAGLVGGLAALPVWDLLKRIRPSES